jgi:hypothetical protein
VGDQERPERPERPGFRDIYDAVDRLEEKVDKRFASKSDVRLWIAGCLIGGQTAAAAVTAYFTRLSPAGQAALAYARVKGWVT